MKFKKYNLILFATLASLSNIFVDPIKAEKNVCYYSNPREFKSCTRKENKKIVPKYPLNIESQAGRMLYFMIWKGDEAPLTALAVGNEFVALELSSSNGENLTVISKNKTSNFWNGALGKKFNSKKVITINSEDIISWGFSSKKEPAPVAACLVNCKWSLSRFYFSYLDDYGNKQTLRGQNHTNDYQGAYIIQNLFRNISNLESGLSRSSSQIINKKLLNTERRVDIIANIIKAPNSTKDSCLEANKNKFPDLTDKYKKLYKLINPLRANLGLNSSNKFKPICS